MSARPHRRKTNEAEITRSPSQPRSESYRSADITKPVHARPRPDAMSPLFRGMNPLRSNIQFLLSRDTVTGKEKRTVEALPLEQTLTILRKYGKIK